MGKLVKVNHNNKELMALPMVGPTAYQSAIKLFNRWLDGRPVNIENIIEYLEEQQKTKKPATISAMKFGIKRAVKELMSRGNTRIEDLARLDQEFKRIKIGRRDPKVYSYRLPSKELTFKAIKKAPERTGLIIETLFYTGLRISELINIKLKDCSTDDKYVYIYIIGKGRKEREIFITRDLFYRIIEVFQGNLYLFETKKGAQYTRQVLYRDVRNAGKNVGRQDFHPHMFRHVCITHLLNDKKKSLKAVSLYAGHADVSITANTYQESTLNPGDVFE